MAAEHPRVRVVVRGLAATGLLLAMCACNPFGDGSDEATESPTAASAADRVAPVTGGACHVSACESFGDVFSQISCTLGTLECMDYTPSPSPTPDAD